MRAIIKTSSQAMKQVHDNRMVWDFLTSRKTRPSASSLTSILVACVAFRSCLSLHQLSLFYAYISQLFFFFFIIASKVRLDRNLSLTQAGKCGSIKLDTFARIASRPSHTYDISSSSGIIETTKECIQDTGNSKGYLLSNHLVIKRD